jgi:hypothetical protein
MRMAPALLKMSQGSGVDCRVEDRLAAPADLDTIDREHGMAPR